MDAKKVLGQNFLTDKNKVDEIINAIPNIENSTVVEVGPGKGALTTELVKKAKKVIAIEIDTDMIPILESKITEDNFTLINSDILKFDIKSIEGDNLSFISNLPYYISTKIIFMFAADSRFEYINVMLQKELVDRIFAEPNNKKYGRLTVAINSMFELVERINVPPTCFTPKPSVDSGFIILKRREIDFDIDEYLLFVKHCFANKRKKLVNSLKNSNSEHLEGFIKYSNDHNLGENIRAEELTIDQFLNI